MIIFLYIIIIEVYSFAVDDSWLGLSILTSFKYTLKKAANCLATEYLISGYR